MTKIDEINRGTEKLFNVYILGFSVNILVAIMLYFINPFNPGDYVGENNIGKLLYLPAVVIITLAIHEAIHIAMFKILGKGQAKIRVRHDKELRAIMIQQMNKEVFYTRIETLWILLSPLVILTLAMIPLLFISSLTMIVYTNILLNSIGSSIDMYLSYRLIKDYEREVKIQYCNGEAPGMIIYTE